MNVAPNRGNARETVLCRFENARFVCVVLWAPDFETKEGIAVYHNALGQLSVLLGGTKRLFEKVIETNGCPRHNPWTQMCQHRPVDQTGGKHETKTKKYQNKNPQGRSGRLLFMTEPAHSP